MIQPVSEAFKLFVEWPEQVSCKTFKSAPEEVTKVSIGLKKMKQYWSPNNVIKEKYIQYHTVVKTRLTTLIVVIKEKKIRVVSHNSPEHSYVSDLQEFFKGWPLSLPSAVETGRVNCWQKTIEAPPMMAKHRAASFLPLNGIFPDRTPLGNLNIHLGFEWDLLQYL